MASTVPVTGPLGRILGLIVLLVGPCGPCGRTVRSLLSDRLLNLSPSFVSGSPGCQLIKDLAACWWVKSSSYSVSRHSLASLVVLTVK